MKQRKAPMSQPNWQLSYNKWTSIVSLLERKGRVDWDEICNLINEECGYCSEHDGDCRKCSLAKYCDEYYAENRIYYVLVLMAYEEIPKNKRKALSIAKRILTAILQDKPEEE